VGGNVANIYHDYAYALAQFNDWGDMLQTSKRFFTLSYNSVDSTMSVKNFGQPISFNSFNGENAFSTASNSTPTTMWEDLQVTLRFSK
jgi:hypothetical protein